MDQPILTLGATGNVGGAVVTRLLAAGRNPRAGVRNLDTYSPPAGAEVVRFDYDDPSTYPAALAGVTAVFAVAPPLDDRADKRMRPFLEAAKEAAVPRLVLLTAIGADDPDAGALHRLEALAAALHLPRVVLRPNWFMDNFHPGFLWPDIRDQGAFYLPTADAASALIAVDDIAACAVEGLIGERRADAVYDLTGPEALDHHQVAEILSDVMGREIRYVAIDEAAARAGMLEAGMEESGAAYLLDLYRRFREGYADDVTGDVEKLIGRPPIGFRAWAEALRA